jgi:hypothetical protein
MAGVVGGCCHSGNIVDGLLLAVAIYYIVDSGGG